MVQNINPSRLKYRVSLGKAGFVETPQGTNRPDFEEIRSLWCGIYTMSMTQQITLLGSPNSFDLVLIIRHQSDGLKDVKYVRFKDQLYQLVGSSPDFDDSPRSFDLITLKKVDKIGIS
ncbi:head-tail adaptor protein [Companilactobacillus allii]|uniref:Phage head-tail adapter protein n=1 Tax=Companilactobacillus allii TaxID=1847728 RepID=A0A1P8Q3P2_9LACO|nr:head-tail adaptor protein [Companilactobacillus allii]APX72482.1 hypothetical protein BTM29_07945 [Companilactobacillus allii]USQ69583.1 head-tail adaptor protein [Companilactobacillus allii]